MQILAEAEDLPKTANIKTQLISLWCVPIFGAALLVAFVAFPGFFPPMSPDMPADQVAAFYRDNAAMIRFSMITFNLCGIMLLPLFMVIVVQMKRMATQSHVFAYCYLTAAVSGATLFAVADIFYLVAAFRPDRNPELVVLLNDMAWIIFIAPVGAIVAMNLLLAAAIYFDDGPNPVFPRWVGHYALATALAMAPAVGAAIFRTGPLAWDGAVSFWLRNGAFALFVVVMFFVLRAALQRQAVEEGVADVRSETADAHARSETAEAQREEKKNAQPRCRREQRGLDRIGRCPCRVRPEAGRQARRVDRVLDRACLLHRVRDHLLRAGQGDATAPAGCHHRSDGAFL